MPREIKFKVWDKDNNSCCPDFFAFQEDGHILWEWSQGDFTKSSNRFQQFTGLKDRNGREIYEGDILNYTLAGIVEDIKVEVRWGDCAWILYDIEYKDCIGHLTVAIKTYEVVGNIFENPELLKI